MTKPKILNAAPRLPKQTVDELNALFDVLPLPADPAAIPAFLAQNGAGVRGMSLAKTPVDAAFLDALPDLEFISSYTAGLDNLDVAAAKARGIAIENTSHVLAREVANLTLGLAIAVTREIVSSDAYLRSGDWAKKGDLPPNRSMIGMKVGVVGLGSIGHEAAKLFDAIGAKVSYSGPHKKPVDYPYYPDAKALAGAVDMLIVCCPLNDATRHSIDAGVLAALGPDGFLVNIARGPVVDEAALVAALTAGQIAGVGLDVFEHEPHVPQALIDSPRAVLTPHIGSATRDTRQGMANNVVDALARHFGLTGPRG